MRITPEMVIEAFQNSGLEPMQGDLFPKEGCACALGAIAYCKGYKEGYKAIGYLNQLTGGNYVSSFGYGFDGLVLPDIPGYRTEEAKQAYEDGKVAWEAVKHLINS